MNPRVSAGNSAKSLVVFGWIYMILFAGGGLLLGGSVGRNHLIGLAASILATLLAVWWIDRGAWNVGFLVAPRLAATDAAAGVGLAVAVVALADLFIRASTTLRHSFVGEFPWATIVALYIPAAIHEELLFRGYAFQKIAGWNRPAAVLLGAAFFAGLHLGNDAVGAVAIANIFLAGVMLSLAYLVHQTLWLPCALHIAWNVMMGPVLGHEVSGFVVPRAVWSSSDRGPVFLTGGAFGIEASVWTTACETMAIGLLLMFIRMARSGPTDVDLPELAAEDRKTNVERQ